MHHTLYLTSNWTSKVCRLGPRRNWIQLGLGIVKNGFSGPKVGSMACKFLGPKIVLLSHLKMPYMCQLLELRWFLNPILLNLITINFMNDELNSWFFGFYHLELPVSYIRIHSQNWSPYLLNWSVNNYWSIHYLTTACDPPWPHLMTNVACHFIHYSTTPSVPL